MTVFPDQLRIVLTSYEANWKSSGIQSGIERRIVMYGRDQRNRNVPLTETSNCLVSKGFYSALVLALILFLKLEAGAQSWQAVSVWGYPVPVTNINGFVTLPIPDSHCRVVVVAIFTTTNTVELLGDLTGATISSTIKIETFENPILYFGNNCGTGLAANMRLYFTTTNEPYTLCHVNANECEYWWADYAVVSLCASNWSRMFAGTFSFTAALDPALWSDSLGHSACNPAYTDAFRKAASCVAQIGFSFGGGCFFDVGVGIFNANNPYPWPRATLTVLDYKILRPAVSLTYDPKQGSSLQVINTISNQSYTVQYSEDFNVWTDLPSVTTTGTSFNLTDVSATNSAARLYRLKR